MFRKGEFDGLDRGVEWRYPLAWSLNRIFRPLSRVSSIRIEYFFFFFSPSPLFPSRRSVSGSSMPLSKWDCIRLAERSATVTVNNYSGQWRKPWQLPIIAISPWQTPTYCRRTIYDEAETRVVYFRAVIIPPRAGILRVIRRMGNFLQFGEKSYFTSVDCIIVERNSFVAVT